MARSESKTKSKATPTRDAGRAKAPATAKATAAKPASSKAVPARAATARAVPAKPTPARAAHAKPAAAKATAAKASPGKTASTRAKSVSGAKATTKTGANRTTSAPTSSSARGGAPTGLPLPAAYGEDKVALLARDPRWAFTYWEVTEANLAAARAKLGAPGALCLRLYDVTGIHFTGSNATFRDQEVGERLGTYYLELGAPTRSFCIDIGLRGATGAFVTLARSNRVTLPPETLSSVIDDNWTLGDDVFRKLYQPVAAGASPMGAEAWREGVGPNVSSPGMSPLVAPWPPRKEP